MDFKKTKNRFYLMGLPTLLWILTIIPEYIMILISYKIPSWIAVINITGGALMVAASFYLVFVIDIYKEIKNNKPTS